MFYSKFIPDVQSITDTTPQNASHDTNVKVSAPIDFSSGVFDFTGDVVIAEVRVNATGKGLKASEVFLTERAFI